MRCAAATTVALVAGLIGPAAAAAGSFTVFESGHVRPIALSPSGQRLFAVNTPDGRLEIFDLSESGLSHVASVPVGLEPVAVAAHTDTEVWVVNHLSDSVSVVDAGASPRVVRTLLVGDEPRDIVFAGPNRGRAFITTAHRGQNTRVDPQLTRPGVGRADVWVFDAAQPGTSLGGDPLTIVTLFADTPRALASTADGAVVYAAAFHSGNQTTTVGEGAICDGGEAATCEVDGQPMPGGLPAPNVNVEGFAQPEVGLLVKFNQMTGAWEDPIGRDWRAAIRLALPDLDVFAIDALADTPAVTNASAHVGTVIYNLAVNPVSGTVYATNTEARNEVRFSGMGIFGGSSVRGHQHESRITVLDGSGVRPRSLNKHIDYDVVPSPAGVKELSLALPTAMAVSSDGATLYVAAFGSGKIGVYDTAELEADTFTSSSVRHIEVPGGGPSGIALDEARGRLYAFARFDNAISAISLASGREVEHVWLHNPEPATVVSGRPLLYDAVLGSSNGEASCASCHVFGDVDSLAWDLGDPDASVVPNPNFVRGTTEPPAPDFHPLKGPLTTQTLRGMSTHGPMHWRGDRTGGYDGGDPRDERAAFRQFNEAFVGLLGRTEPLPDAQMEALTDFVLQIAQPPNPNRGLDRAFTQIQQAGRDTFQACSTACHVIDPAQGYFGTDGSVGLTGTSMQFMKVARLDTFFQKVGMFAIPPPFNMGDDSFIGDQVRGFGFTHDGSVGFYIQNPEIEQFLLVFDGPLAPIVGQQVTLGHDTPATSDARIDLLKSRAELGECDLTVKGVLGGAERGWYLTAAGDFQSDRAAEAAVADNALRAQAAVPGQELTYTCVPPGSGPRIGVDRDEDGFFDQDERDAGTDPASTADAPFICAGDRSLSRGRLKIARPRTASRDPMIAAWGTTTVGGTIDPVAAGFRFSVVDRDRRLLFSRIIPPGAAPSADEAGWTANAERTLWNFKDRSGRSAGGITNVTVRIQSATEVAFRIKGRIRELRIAPEWLPVQFAVSVGEASGECESTAFTDVPPACRRIRSSRGLLCR